MLYAIGSVPELSFNRRNPQFFVFSYDFLPRIVRCPGTAAIFRH